MRIIYIYIYNIIYRQPNHTPIANYKLPLLLLSIDGKAYQKPEILNKLESIYNITYGSNWSMVCEVVGWYEMVWHTDNGRNLTEKDEGSIGVIRITKKRLTIKRFTERDNGIYTCEVQRQNVGWKAKDYIHLKVKEGDLFDFYLHKN